MMTPDNFKTRTTFPRCGRGDELAHIDQRLGEATPLPADGPSAIPLLISLLTAVRRWKISKESKSAKDDWSDVHRARFTVISELEREIMRELQQFAGAGGETGSMAMSERASSYERHKEAGAHKHLRSLGDGYAHERTQFTQQKKKTTDLDSKAAKSVPFGASAVSESIRTIQKDPEKYRGVISDALLQQLQGADLHKMKYDQFMSLADALAKQPVGLQESRVHFLRKTERIERFLTWTNGGKFYKQPGVGYTTPNGMPDIYAMDKYGNLLTMPTRTYFNVRGGNYDTRTASVLAQHNHSSLNAGADVISAGMIEFNQGDIVYIDNNSGHYKPSNRDIQNAVESLVTADNADVSRLIIKVFEMVGGQLRESTYNNAMIFLRLKL